MFVRCLRCVTLFMLALSAPQGMRAQAAGQIAPEAREYLEHALQIMQARSINRAKVDWEQIRSDAFAAAAGAQSTGDTHAAISGALAALGDNHSFLRPALEDLPEELQMVMAAQEPPRPEARRLSENVGYVRVPGFSGPDPDEFARLILDMVLEADAPEVCGWIVDVRGNGGGNMWPMLQGLSPILGEGVPGYFVEPEGSWIPWNIDTETIGSATLAHAHPAVALLQDSVTASSGEAVVVAFRRRPETRSFGQSTDGLSTSNASIALDDGAVMALTVSVYADRDKNLYGESIAPDEPIPAGTPEQEVLSLAAGWLGQQPACSPT